MNTKIIIAGVGGQGILLASDILCEVAMKAGFDTKKSEVHGMSQRGGDVVSHVIFGEKVYSPLISYNEADVILSFEQVEALRNLDYLKDGGVMIINDIRILPVPVASGMADYPKDAVGEVKKFVKNTIVLDAESMAKELGNVKVMNVILLGVMAKQVKIIKKEIWIEALKANVPPKTIDVNIKAFEKGYDFS
ncbi:TPA: indolepyruvate oxidoreductase subunit beta [candidate division WOR-3 bacterium]|jgi:indolepyruvate ferredoxin oxidoreductase beta subunit|uniref:Indolepyruvate oxidoreductase subunit beta n=1 Tax=candidate division WOR-3 bacterium TaxID=2052148 RepID=A0A350HB33_UNCW3|nr:indolepyruvate oxidoreductase subunit beta [candidate division WOR-3 bacterium]